MKSPDVLGTEYLVPLDPDHPGFRDAEYRARRDAIATIATTHRRSDPIPDVTYTEDEHQVWSRVWRELHDAHERYACDAYRACLDKIALHREQIPQLNDVNRALAGASGFQLLPVAGLVQAAVFLDHLGEGFFLSTQYMRHHSRPLYTPEPDVIHELVGHAVTLVDPAFAEMNRLFGAALRRGASVEQLTNVYWYTMEFGVTYESGEPRAYGAGLLSSFGELNHFVKNTPLLAFDIERIAATPYDPTNYQPHLFAARSVDEAFEEIRRWLTSL